MAYGENISGGVYAKGEVAREEAEEKQRKREAAQIWRKNKQEKEQRLKAERLAKREKKRKELLTQFEIKNAPKELYTYADEQEYRQRLTQYFEDNPFAISALKYDRPTTDELLHTVLGLIPKRCGQTVRMAFGRVMRELGFEQVQGFRCVKLSDEQILRQIKRRQVLVDDLREHIRHASELTKKQKKLINEGPPADKPEKCSYWRRPFTGYAKAPSVPDWPIKPVFKSATSQKLPAQTITVPHPIEEIFPYHDTRNSIAKYLADNPRVVEEKFTFKDLTDVRPPIPNLSVEVNPLTFEEIAIELGYVKGFRQTGKVGYCWGLPPGSEADLARIAAKKAVTGAAPDALDDYYDELDDDEDYDLDAPVETPPAPSQYNSDEDFA